MPPLEPIRNDTQQAPQPLAAQLANGAARPGRDDGEVVKVEVGSSPGALQDVELGSPLRNGGTAQSPVKQGGGAGVGSKRKKVMLEWWVERITVGSGAKTKDIVKGVAGKTESGQLTAVLGPSGCGKTTLLHALSLRNRHFEGSVRLNGKEPKGHYMTTTALVHQTQLLFGFMTPREHLTFQAIARMSRKHSMHEINARVEEVLKEARLEKCADTLIGGTDLLFLRRGVSGGERKRVAIATELLLCPDVIFLDEPTSGLDSVMAEVVISIMRDLADRGRIVMTIVHCPSSELMIYFSHMLLLTHNGRLAFHGPRAAAVPHFESLGYKYPLDFNPADYVLRMLSCPAGMEDASVAKAEARRLDTIANAYADSPFALTTHLLSTNEHKVLKRIQGRGATDLTLLRINCWRYSLLVTRDYLTFCLWGLSSLMVGVLIGIVFLNAAGDNWRNLMGMCFSLTVTALMIGMLGNIVRFPMEWAPFSREYFAGSNAVGPYFLSRYVLVVPYMYAPFVMATMVYWMTGLEQSAMQYLKFGGIFVSTMMAAVAMGQFASCLSHNVLVGLSLSPAIITPMCLFSGLMYQRGTIASWLSWIEYTSIINYSTSALVIQQSHILPNGTGVLMLKFLGINAADMNWDIMMLWVIFVIANIATYVALSLRMRIAVDIA